VKIWNELPIHTDFTSINSFERALAGFNFTAYCDIKTRFYRFALCVTYGAALEAKLAVQLPMNRRPFYIVMHVL